MIKTIENTPGLICYWDFEGQQPLASKGPKTYTLISASGNPMFETNQDKSAIYIPENDYFYIPRADCQALNIHGKDAEVTIIAWVKRQTKSFVQCEAIAGMWNETEKKRQYCLFLNLRLFNSAHQVCGHISSVGGATPGQKWCIDASIGSSEVKIDEWTFVAFTYDGKKIKSYNNGELDLRELLNPYDYNQGIFDGGTKGSDFTVGSVHRLGEMGNDFVGSIATLAVYNVALSDAEIKEVFINTQL